MRKFQFVFFLSDLISGSCCSSPSLWKYDLSLIVLEMKENSGINLVSRTPVGQPLVTVWDISPGIVCTLILMNSQSCYHFRLVITSLSRPFFCLSSHTHTCRAEEMHQCCVCTGEKVWKRVEATAIKFSRRTLGESPITQTKMWQDRIYNSVPCWRESGIPLWTVVSIALIANTCKSGHIAGLHSVRTC